MRHVLLAFVVLIGSCSFVNYRQVLIINDEPIEVKAKVGRGLVICDDPAILKLSLFNKVEVPDIDTVPIGDRVGEVTLLLDYIEELENAIERHVKDYGCRPLIDAIDK